MKVKFTTILTISFLLSSCATYHISTQSLLQQMANTQPENKFVFIAGPVFFIPFTVTGNSLTSITVLDIHENEYLLPVTNQTSVRITKNDGTRKTFYFNTLLVRDSVMTGKMDHFIGTNIKPILLSEIAKIELQKH
jgi:hypothetical protein